MWKKLIWVLGLIASVVMIVFGAMFAFRTAVNTIFQTMYERGNHSYFPEELLVQLNTNEPYVPLYNVGNVAYRLGDYDTAVYYYEAALRTREPHPASCDIRVNLALSLLKQVDFDGLTTDAAKTIAIRLLKTARGVLIEEGCAGPERVEEGEVADPQSYHDADAEKLKEEIDRKLKELDPDNSSDQEDQNQDQNPNQDQNKDSKKDQDSQSQGQKDPDQDPQESAQNRKEASREQRIRNKLGKQQNASQKEHNYKVEEDHQTGKEPPKAEGQEGTDQGQTGGNGQKENQQENQQGSGKESQGQSGSQADQNGGGGSGGSADGNAEGGGDQEESYRRNW